VEPSDEVDARLMPCVRAVANGLVASVLEEARSARRPASSMRWRFNDGTVAELGGRITGASTFARELREDLERRRAGVQVHPGPGGGAWLDVNDAALFDAWLRQEAARSWRRELQLELVEHPDPKDLPALPPDRRAHSDDPKARY